VGRSQALQDFYANPDNYTVSTPYVYVEFNGYTTGGYIKNIMMEVGNVPSEYSPAPEDIESEVTSVKTRVTEAETQITKNKEAIALTATKTEVQEVDSKFANYSTTAQMNSALSVKANEITSHVSATYTTKEDFENLEVGGRNLLIRSRMQYGFLNSTNGDFNLGNPSELGDIVSDWIDVSNYDSIVLSLYDTFVNTSNSSWYGLYDANKSNLSMAQWNPRSPAHKVVDTSSASWFRINANGARTVRYKVEKGTIPTDWTPAPEDVDARIESAETRITQTEKDIQLRATTEEMNAAIKVAADGISSEVSSAKNDIEDLKTKVPWVTDVWVDATAYDQSLWIPFTGTELSRDQTSRIYVTSKLTYSGTPSWATHTSGFSVEFEVEDIGNGWGVNAWNQRILSDKLAWCDPSPVSYDQLGYSSTPVLYLRGGGRYRVRTSFESTWTGHPDGYTWTSGQYSQSAPTHTSRPKPVGDSYAWQADMTKAKDDIVAANSRIDQEAGKITNLVSTTDGHESRLAALELTDEAFTIKFENYGGRNYLTNAKRLNNWSRIVGAASWNANHADCPNGVYIVGDQGGNSQLRLNNVITGNGYWTVSFELKGSQSAVLGFYMDICDRGRTMFKTTADNAWKKHSLTVNVTNWSSGTFHFVDFEGLPYAYIYIRNLKIEKGAIATDYTAAPEDVDNAIGNAQTAANNAQSTANTANTNAANADSKAVAAQSTANTANTNATNAQSTATAAQTTANNATTLANNAQADADAAQSTANTASSKADTAQTKANSAYNLANTANTNASNAAKTATNYMKFENNTGLIVGDMTKSTLGRNVLIESESIRIRNNTTDLAIFSDDEILLGIRDEDATINFCEGVGSISVSELVRNTDYWKLNINSQNSIGLNSGGEITMTTDYTNGAKESHNSFTMGSDLPWNDEVYCYSHWTVSGTNGQTDWLSAVDLTYDSASISHVSSPYLSQITLNDSGITLNAAASSFGITLTAYDINVDGTANFSDNVYIDKNAAVIYGKTTSGSYRSALDPCNSNNNTLLGYGNYQANSGNTNVYGKDVNIGVNIDGTHTALFKPYYRSDTSSVSMTLRTSGYVTNNSTDIYFVIPLSKPIVGAPTVSVSSNNGMILRQNNKYTHGTSASVSVKPSSYEVVSYNSGNNIVVKAVMSDITNVTNNNPIGIHWSGYVSFAYG
jgi:hypothetical protein